MLIPVSSCRLYDTKLPRVFLWLITTWLKCKISTMKANQYVIPSTLSKAMSILFPNPLVPLESKNFIKKSCKKFYFWYHLTCKHEVWLLVLCCINNADIGSMGWATISYAFFLTLMVFLRYRLQNFYLHKVVSSKWMEQ